MFLSMDYRNTFDNKAKFVYDWVKLNYDKLKVLNWQSITGHTTLRK